MCQGFVDPIFTLTGLALRCPDYSLVSKREKTVNIRTKTQDRGEISHLIIDATNFKIFDEWEYQQAQSMA